MVIDVHTHAFPEKVAPIAIAHLEACQSYVKACGDGTISALKQSMLANKIDCSVVLPVATKAEQVETINDFAIASAEIDAGIIFFGGMHPDYKNYSQEIERLKKNGIKGIKFHAEFTKNSIDSPEMHAIYSCMAENGLIALHHMGDDLFAGCTELASPKLLAKVMTRHPKLKVIAAHGGGFRRWQEVIEHLAGRPNLWLDTAFLAGYIEDDLWQELLAKHDKIIFGSDYPWMSQESLLEFLRESKLPAQRLDMILGQNLVDLLELNI